ncbi:MAG: branched-chain amino acid ABC transporter permease, partial [Bacillota bacterium]|nr:branched-chain amino acid ABC transporter permease [Bacillota bacterium]
MSAGQQVLQLAVAGLTTGAIYALMALGFVLLFTTTRIINVAIGEFATLAIFFILTFLHRGLTYAAAALAALFVVGVGAVVLYRLFFYPLLRREAGVVVLLIVSIALHLLLRGLALIGWGTRSYALP